MVRRYFAVIAVTAACAAAAAGLALLPAGRTATLVEEGGVLVATGETTIDDAAVFGLIDAARR